MKREMITTEVFFEYCNLNHTEGDPYNHKLYMDLNSNVEHIENFCDGVHSLKVHSNEYLVYIKSSEIIAAVNTNNVDEYMQETHEKTVYLNVLFRELGSDKKLKMGLGSFLLHDDDVYLISDNNDDYKTCWRDVERSTQKMYDECMKIKREMENKTYTKSENVLEKDQYVIVPIAEL